jgi:hypothetical protein
VDTYNALGEISGHELEETDVGDIHVLPVVVFLPLPAALTPLLYNHLPKSKYPITHNRVTTQMFQRITDAERERERVY